MADHYTLLELTGFRPHLPLKGDLIKDDKSENVHGFCSCCVPLGTKGKFGPEMVITPLVMLDLTSR